MDKNRLWLGLVVVAVIVGGFLWVRKGVEKNEDDLLKAGSEKIDVPSAMEKDFRDVGLSISDDAGRTVLKDVSGGSARGSASMDKQGSFYIHYVVADLPELEEGFYGGWLVNSAGDILYTGKLENRKGGWVLEYRTDKDLSDYKKVVITEELVDDQKAEKRILEGNL